MEPLHGSTNQRASLAFHDFPECRAKPYVSVLPERDEFADGTRSQKPVSVLTPCSQNAMRVGLLHNSQTFFIEAFDKCCTFVV